MAETHLDKKRSFRDLLRVSFRRHRLFLTGASLAGMMILLGAGQLWPVKYVGTTIFERRNDVVTGREGGGGAAFEEYRLSIRLDLAGNGPIAEAIKDLERLWASQHRSGPATTRGDQASEDSDLRPRGGPATRDDRPVNDLAVAADRPRESSGTSTTASWRLTGRTPKEQQEVVADMASRIAINWDARSDQKDLINVSFTHPDPWLAENMPNQLVKNYIDMTFEKIAARLREQDKFVGPRVENAKAALSGLKKQKIDFESQNPGFEQANIGSVDEKLTKLDADIDTLHRQANIARMIVDRLKKWHEAGTATTQISITSERNPEYVEIKKDIKLAQDQLDEALRVMTEEHPTILRLRARIIKLKNDLEKTPASTTQREVYGPNPDHVDVTMNLAAKESELTGLTNELERLKNERTAYEELRKNYKPRREQYDKLLEDMKDQQKEIDRWQARLDDVKTNLEAEYAKKRTHLNQVQNAQQQFRPASPTLGLVMMVALLGGLACGGGLVFLANALDRTITTTEEAASYFNVPVHGVISEIITPRQRAVRRARFWIVAPLVTVMMLGGLGLAAFNDFLWLDRPQSYQEWKASPVKFVVERLAVR